MERSGGDERKSREELRDWRLKVDLDEFENVGKLFHEAGIELYAFNYSFREDFTDAEIERGFEMAKALGAKVITASANVSVSKRVDKAAQKHEMRVGMHNHSHIREERIRHAGRLRPRDEGHEVHRHQSRHRPLLRRRLRSGRLPAASTTTTSSRCTSRTRAKEDVNMSFGEGDTPIVECLHLLRDKKYRIPANIEYEYKGGDTVEEVTQAASST